MTALLEKPKLWFLGAHPGRKDYARIGLFLLALAPLAGIYLLVTG